MNKVKQFFLLTLIISVFALNCPGKLYAVLPGDLDSNGVVSIAEAQKVINSFLGLEADSPVITPIKVMFASNSSLTVTGTNLDSGIIVTPTGACTTLREQAGGTASMRTYSCVPDSVGALNIVISAAANGAVLSQAKFIVPNPQVKMETSMGTIVVELNPTKAPKTVKNFLQYVHEGFYSNTIFHRVMIGFVVQGGGFDTSMKQKATHPAIELEPPSVTGLSNTQGTIAMARSSALNSATSQFFFNTVNNATGLDAGYAVFGTVVLGMSVVQKIEVVPVGTNNVPTAIITVTAATQTQ